MWSSNHEYKGLKTMAWILLFIGSAVLVFLMVVMVIISLRPGARFETYLILNNLYLLVYGCGCIRYFVQARRAWTLKSPEYAQKARNAAYVIGYITLGTHFCLWHPAATYAEEARSDFLQNLYDLEFSFNRQDHDELSLNSQDEIMDQIQVIMMQEATVASAINSSLTCDRLYPVLVPIEANHPCLPSNAAV